MHNIILKIKSLFEGEGLNKADQALKDTAKSATSAITPVQKIGNALGQLEGPVGAGARAVTGFVSAVKSMGVIGGIVAGVQLAIKVASDKIVAHFDAMADAAKKCAAEMKDRLQNQIGNYLGKTEASLKSVGKETDADTAKMKDLASSVAKVNTALGRREDAAAAAAAAKLELQKMQALMGIENENVRKVTEAEWDYKIALESGKAVLEARAREEEAAKTAVENAKNAADRASENLEAAKKAQEEAHRQVAELEGAPDTEVTHEALIRAKKNAADADDIVAERSREQSEAETALKTATIELETERKKTETAEYKNRQAVEEAKANRESANLEAQENQRKEHEAAETAANVAKAKQMRDDAQKQAEESLERCNMDLQIAKDQLKAAEEQQAQWESDKASLDRNEFNKVQAANMEKLLAWTESTHSTKALNEKQKAVLSEYIRWKNLMQDTNPYDEMVMKFRQQVNVETSALEEQQRINNVTMERIESMIANGDLGEYEIFKNTTVSNDTTDNSTTDNSVSTSNSNNQTFNDNSVTHNGNEDHSQTDNSTSDSSVSTSNSNNQTFNDNSATHNGDVINNISTPSSSNDAYVVLVEIRDYLKRALELQ